MATTTYERKEALDLYESCNGNSAEAVRKLNSKGIQISDKTVRNIWKSANLKGKKQGGNNKPKLSIEDRLTQEEIDRIRRSHDRYEGNPYLAEKGGAYTATTYTRIWEMHGLQINMTRRPHYN